MIAIEYVSEEGKEYTTPFQKSAEEGRLIPARKDVADFQLNDQVTKIGAKMLLKWDCMDVKGGIQVGTKPRSNVLIPNMLQIYTTEKLMSLSPSISTGSIRLSEDANISTDKSKVNMLVLSLSLRL